MATAERLQPRPVRRIIVGTAGHIDHGKTALVKALTGIDADRLAEEKRRGITIDLGFAYLALDAPDGSLIQLGFIDVPGHERFVRNMLAGAGGVDLVLFVVAADEGIKPQTREHFDICRLLSVSRGLTVLTKADLVDPDTITLRLLELEDFLRGSFLDPAIAPVVAVSSTSGLGVDDLKRELARAASATEAKNSAGHLRLPIDRVFTMKGFGTVVTGTLVSGSVACEQLVEIFPQRSRVRVRNVQVHGFAAERALAGGRTAINLAGTGVAKDDLARGMTLAAPDVFHTTRILDVSLALLAGARSLRNRSRVHLHLFTQETVAEVVLHGGKELAPGKSGVARLRAARPLLALTGDRFIIRQFSPVITIGGGVVLDSAPLKLRGDQLRAFLATLQSGSRAEVLAARVSRREQNGLSASEAVAETGCLPGEVEAIAADLASKGEIVRSADHLFSHAAFDAALKTVVTAAEDFHRKNPLIAGLGKDDLRARCRLPAAIFGAVFEKLAEEKKIALTGELVHLAGRGVVMKDEEADSKRTIEAAFKSAGLKVPPVNDVLASLKIDRARAQRIVALLLRERTLYSLGEDLIFHRDALDGLRTAIQNYKTKAPKIDVGRFKELTGVSRKYAIPLLEYLDRQRVTRRVGDERVIL